MFVSIHPYWTGTSIDGALAELQTRYAAVVAAAGGKPVVISETGWPTCGAVRGAAVPSQENAVRYLGEVTRWAATAKVPYFWLEAYDQAWKANAAEGPVGSCWGLWTENGELKKGFRPLFLAP